MVKTNQKITCDTAKLFYYDVLCKKKSQIDIKVLAHIEECDFCKQKLKELQNVLNSEQVDTPESILSLNNLLESHFEYVSKPVTCTVAKRFLPQLASLMEIVVPTPITVHIDNCKSCQEDLKKLIASPKAIDPDHQISGTKREDISEISTIYKIDGEGDKSFVNTDSSRYTGFAVKVEVIEPGQQIQAESGPEQGIMWKLKSGIRHLNGSDSSNFVKIAASFMLFSALFYAFFFNASRAEAVSLQYIYEALARISNIHIVRSSTEGHTRAEQWISRDSGLYILKTKNQLAVYDIIRADFSIYSSIGQVESHKLTEQQTFEASQNIENIGLIMPYHSIAEFPDDTRFEQIPNDMTETAYSEHTVYRLTWDEIAISGNSRVNLLRKWELFFDPETELPSLIRIYGNQHDNASFELSHTIFISYPADIDPETIKNNFLN